VPVNTYGRLNPATVHYDYCSDEPISGLTGSYHVRNAAVHPRGVGSEFEPGLIGRDSPSRRVRMSMVHLRLLVAGPAAPTAKREPE